MDGNPDHPDTSSSYSHRHESVSRSDLVDYGLQEMLDSVHLEPLGLRHSDPVDDNLRHHYEKLLTVSHHHEPVELYHLLDHHHSVHYGVGWSASQPKTILHYNKQLTILNNLINNPMWTTSV